MQENDNVYKKIALSRRWIRIAGKGLESGVPEGYVFAAKAVGKELAKHSYGLITGVCHGVDYVVKESFLNQLCSLLGCRQKLQA